MLTHTHTHTNVEGLRWVWPTAWLADQDPSEIIQHCLVLLNDMAMRMPQVSLYRYCQPSIPYTIAQSVLADVNKEVKLVAAGQKKKRGSCKSYLSFKLEGKMQVAQYSSVSGVRSAG